MIAHDFLQLRSAAWPILSLIVVAAISAPTAAQTSANMRRAPVMKTATGTFEVKMTPQGEPQASDGLTLGRFLNEKRFAGDLEGKSRGEMLTAMTSVENSAGYVLIERVEGTLEGRAGSFVLQHSSTVARGAQKQSIVVVPDSGTGSLAGLTGEMTVEVSLGKHAYMFRYSLPE
jgi:hypothetical protein